MGKLSVFATIILLLSCRLPAISVIQDHDADTASINNQTLQAYIVARRNPDLAIMDAHRALSSSRAIQYEKGIADASLALGMAYFAKYNPGDSAIYYNIKALDIYNETGDIVGKARAFYCLAYVYSLKGMLDESEEYSRLSLDSFEEAGDKPVSYTHLTLPTN